MSLESIRDRNKDGKLDRLLKAAGRTSRGKSPSNNVQEETWYPERDKSGNGSAIIRFLPGLESEDYPYYVERFQHGFEVNNKWFIDFCPSTKGNDCPVCEDAFDTIGEYGRWNDVPKNVQDIIRKRGRNAGFRAGNYCNILVIQDPANPDNEGKVHLFKFGKAISDMIFDMAQPVGDGLGDVPDPVDVFDLAEGANFKFIIRSKDGRADYSKSSFLDPSPCPEFNEDSQIPLMPLVDDKLFKSYEELADKFAKVMNKAKRVSKTADEVVTQSVENKDREDVDLPEPDDVGEDDGKEDDNLAYFQGIAADIKI